MGNSMSCMTIGFHCPTIKVLHAGNGRISELPASMKAAELMLEYPNHFVIHSSCLSSGQRISPLSANEELKPAHVYILLPMQKLHSRFSWKESEELSAMLAKSATGKPASTHAHSKVAPLRGDAQGWAEQDRAGLSTSGEEGAATGWAVRRQSGEPGRNSGGGEDLGSERAILRTRSWVPKLETINERGVWRA